MSFNEFRKQDETEEQMTQAEIVELALSLVNRNTTTLLQNSTGLNRAVERSNNIKQKINLLSRQLLVVSGMLAKVLNQPDNKVS